MDPSWDFQSLCMAKSPPRWCAFQLYRLLDRKGPPFKLDENNHKEPRLLKKWVDAGNVCSQMYIAIWFYILHRYLSTYVCPYKYHREPCASVLCFCTSWTRRQKALRIPSTEIYHVRYLRRRAPLRRSMRATSLKCNYVAIGEVWMWMMQFMDDLVLMDGYWAIPVHPHPQHTHAHTLAKALVPIRINERWTYGGWGDEYMAQCKERAVEVFCVWLIS